MVQAIIYSKATGRVRRVVDPQVNVPNVIKFINSAGAGVGEAVLVYTKQGGGLDTLNAWQAAVNAHTGMDPDVAKADWYVAVDALNNIVEAMVCDPACGDTHPGGLMLVKAPWGANESWTYDGVTLTPPPAITIKPITL